MRNARVELICQRLGAGLRRSPLGDPLYGAILKRDALLQERQLVPQFPSGPVGALRITVGLEHRACALVLHRVRV